MKKPVHRRNFFIKKDLQGKLIFHSFLLAFAGVVAFALIFSLLSADNLTISYQDQYLRIGRTPMILLKQLLTAHWLFLVFVGFFIVANTLLLSHRIAGPHYRLEQTFSAMENKNLDQCIHLRAKDLGKELAEQLNRINAMLSGDLHRMQRLCKEMELIIAEQREGPDIQRREELQKKLTALNKHLSGYQLRPESE